jgi:hypothetical protein
LQDKLLQPVSKWEARAVGVACLLASVLLGAFTLWGTFMTITRNPTALALWLLLSLSAALALLFGTAGYRLVASRPNRTGSVLPPVVWAVLALVFLAHAIAGLVFSLVSQELQHVEAIIILLLLALLSYGAWSHFAGRRRGRSAA